MRVLSPELERRDGVLPHVYAEGTLCLYLPEIGEWRPDKLLVETIVPWTCEWLANYEAWVVTGEWFGGGTHAMAVAGEPCESAKEDR